MPPQNTTFQYPAMLRARGGPMQSDPNKPRGWKGRRRFLSRHGIPTFPEIWLPHDSPRLDRHFLSIFFFIISLRIGGAGDCSFSLLRSSFFFCVSYAIFFAIFAGDLAPGGVNSALFAVVSCRVFVFFFSLLLEIGLYCWVCGGGWCCEMTSYCVFEHFGRERCSLWGIELGSFFSSFVFFEHFLWVCW